MILDVEVMEPGGGTCHQKYHLRTTTRIKLVGMYGTLSSLGEYAYCVRWRMGRMRYKLQTNKLTLISELNQQFAVDHVII